MATVIPPPTKRQKTEAAARARSVPSPPPTPPEGRQRIQFRDADTGKIQGSPVTISLADLEPKNLSLLLNSLLGQNDVDSRLPYRFYNPLDPGSGADFDQTSILKAYADGKITTELTLEIPCRAEAVFKVKAVTRCSSSIAGHGESILTASFSPATSSRLATGSGDNTARIWDCETGTPLHTLKGHTGWVLCLAWSPDAGMLATGSMDKTVRLWDPVTGKPLGSPLKGHTQCVTSIAWEPYHLREQGRPRLASASKDFTIRIWDAVNARTDFALTGHTGYVSAVKWGGKGQIYSASRDRSIKIWDASKGTLLQTLTAHTHWVNSLALSTDYALRTAFYDEKGTKSIPLTTSDKRAKAKERYEAALATSSGVERLVSASDDCTMYLWNPSASSKPINRLHGHQQLVNQVLFSPTGHLIASAGFDNSVRLWNASDGKFVRKLIGHVGPVHQVAFSPDSRLLVSGSADSTLKVWDTRTGERKEDLPGHKDKVFAVDWSPDGERVGSGGQDREVRVWRH